MGVPYDLFFKEFLSKITERELISLAEDLREEMVIGYMKRSIRGFKRVCQYDLVTTADDIGCVFNVDIPDVDLLDVLDIVSEGMIVQWLKPYKNNQDLLENSINTRDFTTYSPSELLMRVGDAYESAKKEYTQMVRDYSFTIGDLTELHL